MKVSVPELKKLIPPKEIIDNDPILSMDCGDGIDNEKVIEYITYCYHPETQFSDVMLGSFMRVKFEAAKLAEFPVDKKTNKFTEKYEHIIMGYNDIVKAKIMSFLKHTNNPTYLAYMTLLTSYEDELQTLSNISSKPTDDTVEAKDKAAARKNILANMKEMKISIAQAKSELTRGDDSKEMLMVLYQTIRGDGLGLSPEEIAERLVNGEDPLYGYKVYSN